MRECQIMKTDISSAITWWIRRNMRNTLRCAMSCIIYRKNGRTGMTEQWRLGMTCCAAWVIWDCRGTMLMKCLKGRKAWREPSFMRACMGSAIQCPPELYPSAVFLKIKSWRGNLSNMHSVTGIQAVTIPLWFPLTREKQKRFVKVLPRRIRRSCFGISKR